MSKTLAIKEILRFFLKKIIFGFQNPYYLLPSIFKIEGVKFSKNSQNHVEKILVNLGLQINIKFLRLLRNSHPTSLYIILQYFVNITYIKIKDLILKVTLKSAKSSN